MILRVTHPPTPIGKFLLDFDFCLSLPLGILAYLLLGGEKPSREKEERKEKITPLIHFASTNILNSLF
jgi:hypothetical protein